MIGSYMTGNPMDLIRSKTPIRYNFICKGGILS